MNNKREKQHGKSPPFTVNKKCYFLFFEKSGLLHIFPLKRLRVTDYPGIKKPTVVSLGPSYSTVNVPLYKQINKKIKGNDDDDTGHTRQ